MILVNRIIRHNWIFILLLLSWNSVKSQVVDCNHLSQKNDIVTFDNKPFSGVCQSYDNDSVLLISRYSNGKLDGDSAYSRYYKNGLCKSNAKYLNGELIDFKEIDYYGVLPMIGGENGGYVDRNWIIKQTSLDIGKVKLTEQRIEKTPQILIVDNPDYDISSYKILSFTFSSCCRPGPDIQYSSKSNQLPKFVIEVLRDLPNDYYYFSDILCQMDNDTIRLPDIKFKLK